MLRHKLNPNHPVIGETYRLLTDDDIITESDETARVSLLLSPEGEQWACVYAYYPEAVGVTVAHACTNMGDMDGSERVFRRRGTMDCGV